MRTIYIVWSRTFWCNIDCILADYRLLKCWYLGLKITTLKTRSTIDILRITQVLILHKKQLFHNKHYKYWCKIRAYKLDHKCLTVLYLFLQNSRITSHALIKAIIRVVLSIHYYGKMPVLRYYIMVMVFPTYNAITMKISSCIGLSRDIKAKSWHQFCKKMHNYLYAVETSTYQCIEHIIKSA